MNEELNKMFEDLRDGFNSEILVLKTRVKEQDESIARAADKIDRLQRAIGRIVLAWNKVDENERKKHRSLGQMIAEANSVLYE